MKYRIEHESSCRMRIHLYTDALTDSQTKVIDYAFSAILPMSIQLAYHVYQFIWLKNV